MKKLSILMFCLVIFLFSLPCTVTAEEIATGENIVFIKGGCFQMGDTLGGGDTDEQPVHKVCVDDFYMGKYEVTQKEWVDVMGTNPSHFKGCDNCPVENVSWDDIQEYINKLNQKTGKRYRLPTEAEWEYAARSGGKSEKYSGTSSKSEVSDYAWYISNSGSKTHPAGEKKSNGLGIYDMTGNVWEWVQDWYDENYYKSSPENNPQGPSNGDARVLRGGSWHTSQGHLRSTYRNREHPGKRSSSGGFRYVMAD